MSAALKIREGLPNPHLRGQPWGVILPTLPGELSAYGVPDSRQYAEKLMGTNTRSITVKPEAFAVKSELAAWAKSDQAKVLSIRTGISVGRIYDWRSERFGANAVTLEIIRAGRLREAKRRISEAKAIIRQSLGELANLDPDAVEKIVRGQ